MNNSFRFILVIFFIFPYALVFSQEINKKDLASNIEKKHPLLANRFAFYVGAYSSNKNFKVKVNGASDNEIIDFSEKFDFNNNENTLFLNFNWRFARMWSLSAEYFSVKNGIEKNIEEQFEWGDDIFNGGAGIKLGMNISMYRVMIGRTISKGLKHELGAGLGTHALDIESYIEGYAFINNDDTGEGADVSFKRNTVSAVAPLPNIGAWYYYAPNDKWLLTARVDWLAISINNYRGNMWNLGAGANYQFHKNIGVGLKYRYFDFTSKIDEDKWDGEFTFVFHGPLLTLNANF